jgi:ethanolamine permease
MTIGRGSLSCVFTLFATSLFTLFVCAFLPPQSYADDDLLTPLSSELSPLNNGFQRIFKMADHYASILSIPATFATAFGFIYGYGRVILSMARSGLFPPILKSTYGPYRSPYMAILFGSIISYIMVIVVNFVPVVETYLFSMCILCGFAGYISQFYGYIFFRMQHPDQERLYKNPFGIPGAVYGIIIFSLSSVSIMGFQDDSSVAFIIFLCIMFICTIYYFTYAKSRQYFSVEEKFIFVLQIVKCKLSSF